MAEIEEEVIGSQSEESLQDDSVSMDDVYEAFGIEKEAPKEEEKAAEDAPAIERQPEPKTIKVKHNKEEIEVDVSDDKLPEYVQKSLALDKERERKTELEKNLDRAAKLAGFNDHAEYIANLDKLEQQQQQQQQTALQQREDEFEQLKKQVIEDLVYNGVDEQAAREYAEKNPLVQKAKEALDQKQQAESDAQETAKWQPLYAAYPELGEAAKKADWTWVTPELMTLVKDGNAPLMSYQHLNLDKIVADRSKKTEQRLIKEQHLGLRAQVETVPSPDNEPTVPKALEDAFEAFGLGKSAAKKYVK